MREAATPANTCLRLADVIASLSLATDLAMGQPPAFALRACVLAVRVGEALGLDDAGLAEVYYQALLRYIGCNAETYAQAALYGDELALRRDFALADSGNAGQVLKLLAGHIRRANAGAGPLHVSAVLAHGLLTARSVARDAFAGHCEVAQRLAERLGFGPSVLGALGQLYERWDGHGLPHGIKGEAIAPSVRIVSLVQDAAALCDAHGPDAAIATVRQRSGSAYDPAFAQRFCAIAPALLGSVAAEPSWDEILALEPQPHVVLSEERFDAACLAMADFADLKSPFALGHSRAVAELAAEAARRGGLTQRDAVLVRRAGLLHDIGSVAVSAAIWCKPGALSRTELEQVRLHAYYTERILAQPAALSELGAIAGHHHERIDGSGYHRAVRGAAIAPAAKILAAGDAYQAMLEPRPHRPARAPDEAARELRADARAGRLDGDAVAAVLNAAGHQGARARRESVAGLTERELDVLRLLARGHSTKAIGAELRIAAKTADNHIQSIYGKVAVSTRAGATLFAMEHGLLA